MMTNHKQNQKSGANSTNIQANQITVGLSHTEAKQLFMDLFKQNAMEYINEAHEKVYDRINHFADKFMAELARVSPESIKNFSDPDIQSTIFEAQRGYAKKGTPELEGVLITMLVERAKSESIALKEAILNEAIIVAPKLTTAQINLLSLLFLLKNTINHGVVCHATLKNYLIQNFSPLLKDIKFSELNFRHLEFHGCISITMGSTMLDNIFDSSYGGLFSKGFDKLELENLPDSQINTEKLFVKCMNDESKLQVNVARESDINVICEKLTLSDEWKTKLVTLHKKNKMNGDELKCLIGSLYPDFILIFDEWMKSMLNNSILTTVGRAVAISNMHGLGHAGFKFDTWLVDR